MTREPKTPVCLTIAGLDPSGGAGIVADIRTISAFGCYPAVALTSVTFQNTQGVYGAEHQTGESVTKQLKPIFDDLKVEALKTGMLPTGEVIEAVAKVLIAEKAENIVVDPVVRSTSGFDLIDDIALRELIIHLFPLALVVTPNLQEAERICGFEILHEDGFERAAETMLSYGARYVLIKGGHRPKKDQKPAIAVDRLFGPNGLEVFESEFIETTSTHGTGCTLSASIAANLGKGKQVSESVAIAKVFVTEAIRTAEGHGKGNSPVNHWAGVKIVGER